MKIRQMTVASLAMIGKQPKKLFLSVDLDLLRLVLGENT
jgi:hypothetical protein